MSERSAGSLERAVELDPNFARAWAWLSIVKLRFVWNAHGLAPEWVNEAKAAVDRALELAPEDPYVRLSRGTYFYYGERDYDRALLEFQAVQSELPNDADVAASIGAIHRRQGQLGKAIESYGQALVLDPLNISHWRELSWTYFAMRRYLEAEEATDQGIELAQDNARLYWDKAFLLARLGNTRDARKVLAQAPVTDPMHSIWGLLEFLDRDFEAALEHFEKIPNDKVSEELGWGAPWRADTLAQLDRDHEARDLLQSFASQLEELKSAGSVQVADWLGLTYARLGRAEDAIREINQEVDRWAGDSFSGPKIQERLAYAYAILGEADAAVAIFDHLLAIPCSDPLTIEFLRIDPRLDPIRDHPRFQALLKKYEEE